MCGVNRPVKRFDFLLGVELRTNPISYVKPSQYACFNKDMNPSNHNLTVHWLAAWYTCSMEKLDVTSRRGAAKVVGTVASLGGAMIMSLYKGQAIRRLWGALLSIPGTTVHEDWVKGSILTIASCFAWAVWYVMQVYICVHIYIHIYL